jgi:hypothetical protein
MLSLGREKEQEGSSPDRKNKGRHSRFSKRGEKAGAYRFHEAMPERVMGTRGSDPCRTSGSVPRSV